MRFRMQFLSSTMFTTLILTGSYLTLNSCQKDAIVKESVELTSSFSASDEQNAESLAKGKSSLVGWYSFQNGSLKDRSIYHNDITFNNATVASDRHGKEGNAYKFNGYNSYMRVANSASLNPSTAITLFAVVKVSGFYPGKCHGNRFINKGADDYVNGHYGLGYDDNFYTNGLNCSQDVNAQYENFTSSYGSGYLGKISVAWDTTNFIKKEKWYRVAYTYTDGVSKMYVNGKLVYTNPLEASFIPNNEDLFLGTTNNYYYPYWFNGTMDEILIFNEALSGKEIAVLSKL